jgi:hypothetical protein
VREWSAEEQTMIDLMDLNGWAVSASIDKERTDVVLFHSTKNYFTFRADTAYEALRKAFNYWAKHNEAN